MLQKIFPCIWHDGNAKQAAEFYCTVFENSEIMADNGMVVTYSLSGHKFMGLNGGPMFKVNPSISFFVACTTVKEVETKWKLLSEGGMVLMPLNTYPWSEKYGWCQDKYGVHWQVMLHTGILAKIFPCMMFTQNKSGKAGEAMDFYSGIFKNSNAEMTARYEKGEPDVEGYIKHARFTLESVLFSIMDSSGPHMFTFNEGLSFVVSCANQAEIDYYWSKLTAGGGQESMCGWLKDKYGVSWQIVPYNIDALLSSPKKMQKISPVLMQMKKLDMAALEKAAE